MPAGPIEVLRYALKVAEFPEGEGIRDLRLDALKALDTLAPAAVPVPEGEPSAPEKNDSGAARDLAVRLRRFAADCDSRAAKTQALTSLDWSERAKLLRASADALALARPEGASVVAPLGEGEQSADRTMEPSESASERDGSFACFCDELYAAKQARAGHAPSSGASGADSGEAGTAK